MANITLSGTLLDPNSGFAARDKIRFTHKTTTGSTLKGSVSTLVIGADGAYSIDLQYGLVLVERRDSTKSQYINLGVVTVNADNPATTLPELLSATVPVSSEELIEFQSILADCVAAQLAAEAAAEEAAQLGSNTGASLVGTSSGATVQQSLDALTAGQTGGVIVFATYALLDAYTPADATEEKSSFKVTNDSNTALNGYYSWVSGTAYTKDADLANGVVEAGNVDAVSGGAVFENAKRNRYQVLGEWTKFERVSGSEYTLANNRLYLLVDTGFIPIAVSTSDITVLNNQMLVVDIVNGARDGSNAVIPEVVSIGSVPVASGDYFVLFACSSDIIGGMVNIIKPFLTLEQDLQDNTDLANKSQTNSEIARGLVVGKWSKCEDKQNGTFLVSNARMYVTHNNDGTKTTTSVAEQTDVIIPNNKMLVIDRVNGAVDGTGAVIPQILDYSVNDVVSGDYTILFYIRSGIPYSSVGFIAEPQNVEPRLSALELLEPNQEIARYTLLGKVTDLGPKLDDPSITVINSPLMWIFQGSYGVGSYKIAPMVNVEVPTDRPLYIDLDGPTNASGEYVPIVGAVDYISGSTYGVGAFVKDRKVLLFVNESSGGNIKGGLIMTTTDQVGRFFGHAVFPWTGCVITFDPDTRTLAWTGDIYFQSANAGRLRLNAGSITFSDSGAGQVAFISLQDVDNYSNADPALCVKQGRYYTGTDRYTGDDNQIPLFYYSSGQFGSLAGFPKAKLSTATSVNGDTRELIVKVATVGVDEVMFVYSKGGKASSSRYIKWRFEKMSRPDINSYVWHTQRAWEVDIDAEGVESIIREVVTYGENETAIAEQGKADFIGGTAHGDEQAIWAYALVDGVEIDTTVSATYNCGQFELVQKSRLWEEGTNATVEFGINYKKWTMREHDMWCDQRTVASKTSIVTSWYHTLWCINRSDDGVVVSNYGARAPEWEREDIELEGHTIITSNTREIMAWGDAGVKFDAEVELAQYEGNEIEFDFFFQNTVGYNKAYFNAGSFIGTFNAGEVVQTRHRYTINTNN